MVAIGALCGAGYERQHAIHYCSVNCELLLNLGLPVCETVYLALLYGSMTISALCMPFGGWVKHLTPSLACRLCCITTPTTSVALPARTRSCRPSNRRQSPNGLRCLVNAYSLGTAWPEHLHLSPSSSHEGVLGSMTHCQRAAAPFRRLAERCEASRNLLDNISCCFAVSKLRMLGSTQTMLT
jgi:hypothetical protein